MGDPTVVSCADAGQKLVDIKITRMEHHHVVVVAQLSDRDQGGLARDHGYWLCRTIDQRRSASSSATSSLQSMISA